MYLVYRYNSILHQFSNGSKVSCVWSTDPPVARTSVVVRATCANSFTSETLSIASGATWRAIGVLASKKSVVRMCAVADGAFATSKSFLLVLLSDVELGSLSFRGLRLPGQSASE